jgi:hypothetical protein
MHNTQVLCVLSATFEGAAKPGSMRGKGNLAVALPKMKLFLVIPPTSEEIDFQNTRET